MKPKITSSSDRITGISMLRFLSMFLLIAAGCVPGYVHGASPLSGKGGTSTAVLRLDVSGRVLDETGQPLPGATVKVKGLNVAAVTNSNGEFTLKGLNGNEVLVISFMGHQTQELALKNQTNLVIRLLPDDKSLSEVVVVGYGTQKKVNLSGSVSAINYDKELQNRPITNVGQAISGNASGITVAQGSGQPGRDGTVLRVRGVGTLNNSDPLVLVDGIVSSIANVNPNDVDNISVLKDAASAAIYGSRAANGVVLITTKRGRAGKTVINYNGYYGIQDATNLFEPISNYALYMETMNKIQKSDNPGNANLFQQSTIDAWRNATDRTLFPNTNWIEEIFKRGTMGKHNLSVSGGSEKTAFYLSGAFQKNDGIMQGTDLKRYELRLNMDHQVSSKIKVGGNISMHWTDMNEPFDVSTMLNNSSNATPGTTPKMVVDGEVRYGGRNTADESAEVVNPLQYLETWFYPQTRQNVFAKLYGEYAIIKGLKLQVNGSVDFNNEVNKQYKYAGPITNTWNFQTMQIVSNFANQPAPMQQRNDNSIGLTFYSTLNYQTTIAKDHELNVLGGISREWYRNAYFLGYIQDFPTNTTWELNAGLAQPRVAGTSSDYALLSYFSRANYSFKQRYILEANLRYDGSSRFREGKRWGLFPSFSGAWRVTEEPVFKAAGIPAISDLKLRASWGKLGNQNIDLFQYTNLYSSGQNYVFGTSLSAGLAPTSLANPDITWETTTTTDFGMDIGLFKNLLTLTVDYFDKKTDNILVRLPLSSLYGGLTAPYQNVGKVQNRGWEFELTHQHKINKFSYSVSGNFSYANNKVLKFQGDPNVIQSTGNQSIIKAGEAINALYGYEVAGIFQNQDEVTNWAKQKPSGTNKPGDLKYRDINNDNVINAQDRVIIGNVIPKISYGFGADASYAGFNFHVLFQGLGKFDRYYQNLWYTSAIRFRRAINSHFLNAWTPENPNTNIPRLTLETNSDNVQPSSYWVQNASFLRLKDVQIGYTISSKVLKNTFISSIQIYANGQNLFASTKFNGLDPETANALNARIEYPNVRIFSFGLNANF